MMNETEFKQLVDKIRDHHNQIYSYKSNETHLTWWQKFPFLLTVNTGKYKDSVMRIKGFTTLDHDYEKGRWGSRGKKSGLICAEVDEKMGNRGKCYYVSYKRFDVTNLTKTKLISSDLKVKLNSLDFFDRELGIGDYVFGLYNNNMSFGIVKETATLKNETKVLVSFIKFRYRRFHSKKSFIELSRQDKNESLKVWIDPSNFVKLDPLEFLQYDMK